MADSSPQPHEPIDEHSSDKTGKGQHKRTSRACLACRTRKSKCTLDSQDGTPHPPCQRCKREGKDCVIGSSNRGGRRVRRSTLVKQSSITDASPTPSAQQWSLHGTPQAPPIHTNSHAAQAPTSAFSTNAPPTAQMSNTQHGAVPMQIDPVLNNAEQNNMLNPRLPEGRQPNSRSSSDDIAFNDLQNPSDALDILAHIASNGDSRQSHTPWNDRGARPPARQNSSTTPYLATPHPDLDDYYPIRTGVLTYQKLVFLLDRYRLNFHPFYPLVQRETLNPANLAKTARSEQHVLTALLTIASRDLADEPLIFNTCSEHMQNLVSAVVAGAPAEVEAVEALLMLAEWTPYTSRRRPGHVGRGEEDREAWMHVGNALRVGYFLGIDKYSFRTPNQNDLLAQRKRLIWTACYISDRQISIRIGRGFWSRGPGPLTTLKREDFPSLLPQSKGEDDYAAIFQATLELTMLFSNVHDVLYSNPASFRQHLSGGYIKFIDDFRSAIYGWKSVYGTLICSQKLSACLDMSYDYLRLYTNAFAFHATVQRALPKTADGRLASHKVFHNNVGAVGDVRFIYEGLDAAKSLLTKMNNFVDSKTCLPFMPLRFYLYCIYAGVFLYRARTVGVISPEEEVGVRRVISQTVEKLQDAASDETHPGARYSQLLKLLWEKVDRPRGRKNVDSIATLIDPYRPGADGRPPGLAPTPNSNASVLESPLGTEPMGDFSWTDLDAIGNFAVNGNDGMGNDGDWWASGFLPGDNGPFGMSGMGFGMDSSMGWDMTI